MEIGLVGASPGQSGRPKKQERAGNGGGPRGSRESLGIKHGWTELVKKWGWAARTVREPTTKHGGGPHGWSRRRNGGGPHEGNAPRPAWGTPDSPGAPPHKKSISVRTAAQHAICQTALRREERSYSTTRLMRGQPGQSGSPDGQCGWGTPQRGSARKVRET
jgi:hypothetical protein